MAQEDSGSPEQNAKAHIEKITSMISELLDSNQELKQYVDMVRESGLDVDVQYGVMVSALDSDHNEGCTCEEDSDQDVEMHDIEPPSESTSTELTPSTGIAPSTEISLSEDDNKILNDLGISWE